MRGPVSIFHRAVAAAASLTGKRFGLLVASSLVATSAIVASALSNPTGNGPLALPRPCPVFRQGDHRLPKGYPRLRPSLRLRPRRRRPPAAVCQNLRGKNRLRNRRPYQKPAGSSTSS